MKLYFVFSIIIIFIYYATEATTTSDINRKQSRTKQSRTYFPKKWKRGIRKKNISQRKFFYITNSNIPLIKRNNTNMYYINDNVFNKKSGEESFFLSKIHKKIRLIKFQYLTKLLAKKKGVGSTKNGRDSNPKNLGVKILGNNFAFPGNIIVRQRGRTFKAGYGVKEGRDFTLVATKFGKVHFFKGKVSIIDVSEPRKLTFQDIYQQDPTIISLSKMWVGA